MNYPNRMKVNQNEIIEEKPIQFANRGMDSECVQRRFQQFW